MKCTETQGFGKNPSLYRPLKGHTGKDVVCGFLSPIKAEFDGYVYKTLTKEKPGSDGFTGVFQIVEQNGVFEFLYGHLNEIYVTEGQYVKKGQIIGLEGNQGMVRVNGVEPTLAERRAGKGHHVHYQKRPVTKVKDLNPQARYLDQRLPNDIRGYQYRDKDGFFYEIPDYNNGFNGCCDFDLPSVIEGLEGQVATLTKLRNLYLELRLLYQQLNKK